MNTLKCAWGEGRSTFNGWMMLPGAAVAETMATQPWDSITIDLQHGLIDYADALGMLVALDAAGVVPLVRIPALESGIIGKMLDAGAQGIICPIVNTARQAEQLVGSMRYPPAGTRSFGPLRPIFRRGLEYVGEANQLCLAIAQIETAAALENLEEILLVDGLDAIYIGPSDLAMDLGIPLAVDSEDPALLEVLGQILETARQFDVPVGMHCMSPGYAKKMLDVGFDLITAGTDVSMIMASSESVLALLNATDG